MLPLCNKAISLQIDRPSPDIFLLASVVNNGSNILSIKFLLKYIKNHDFSIFAIYRVVIAIIVLVKYFCF